MFLDRAGIERGGLESLCRRAVPQITLDEIRNGEDIPSRRYPKLLDDDLSDHRQYLAYSGYDVSEALMPIISRKVCCGERNYAAGGIHPSNLSPVLT